MIPSDFNKAYEKCSVMSNVFVLVDSMPLKDAMALQSALKEVQEWVGITMRDEALLSILDSVIRRKSKEASR